MHLLCVPSQAVELWQAVQAGSLQAAQVLLPPPAALSSVPLHNSLGAEGDSVGLTVPAQALALGVACSLVQLMWAVSDVN